MTMSLDGYVAGPRGAGDLSVGDELPEVRGWKVAHLRGVGTHIMGSVTYRQMAAHWPSATDEYASFMNTMQKVVCSKTLRDASWPETRIARGDLAAEVAALREARYTMAGGVAGRRHALCLLAGAERTKKRNGHDAWLVRLVAPGVAGAILDYHVAGPDECLLTTVELEPDLSREDHHEVDRVGGVHAGIVGLEHLDHPGEVLSHFSDPSLEVEVWGDTGGVGAEGDQSKPEAASRREPPFGVRPVTS
jgi:hypothetical protein